MRTRDVTRDHKAAPAAALVLVARGIEANKGFEHVLAEVTAARFAVFF